IDRTISASEVVSGFSRTFGTSGFGRTCAAWGLGWVCGCGLRTPMRTSTVGIMKGASTPPLAPGGIAIVLNAAPGQQRFQLLEAFLAHQRVVEVQILQRAQSAEMRNAGVSEIHAVELQGCELRQPRQLGEPRVRDFGVLQIQ